MGKQGNELSLFTEDLPQAGDFQWIPADHPDFYFIGRIDMHHPTAPILIWQGSEVRACFSGRHLGLRFSDAWGENFFNVIMDGQIRLLHLEEGGSHDYWLNETLAEGDHQLIIFKRTEALFSHATFQGLFIEKNARFGPRPQPLPLRMEFYGDSITAGACNENPGDDNYDDYSTHNNYQAYGGITARNCNAEYVCIAVSGTGICYSWNPVLMPEVWDRFYPDPASCRYDFGGRHPDIVVINLGQNDYGFSLSIGQSFPGDFAAKYTGLVHSIRCLYPEAAIICSIGGMPAYWESPQLQNAFQEALRNLQRNDDKLFSLTFRAYSINHPRVEIHQKLADELTSFIRKQVLPELS